MRDQLAHRYFDTTHAIVASTVVQDLPHLRAAVGAASWARTAEEEAPKE